VAKSPRRRATSSTTIRAREPDELLVAIHYPIRPRARIVVDEVARRRGDFATAGLVARVECEGGRVVASALAWFSMGPGPLRSPSAEAALNGIAVSHIDPEALADLAVGDTDPFDDHRAPASRHGPRPGDPRAHHHPDGGTGVKELTIKVQVNDRAFEKTVPVRKTLLDFLRQDCGLTGTHAGCEHGVCGACTVIVDGLAARSCLMFAAQADGAVIRTVEGVAEENGELHAVQEAMRDSFGLQCGFCTPGIIMTLVSMTGGEGVTEDEMINALSGHICRCTGYQGIRRAVKKLAKATGEIF
jgi:carbon-monoxide dehydrogenase small subunit